jgi:predicted dehydrogenase
MSGRTRVAVVGAGHMGAHHARIYREMSEAELVAVVDVVADKAEKLAGGSGARACTRLDELPDGIEAASVAVPTLHHLPVATALMQRGIAVLVEKPLAGTVGEAERLVAAAKTHGCVLTVGHTERFNPVVRAIQRLAIQPRFVETSRISPFSFRSADIGVVADMMIHDIDIVLHLVRSPWTQVDAVGVNVLVRHEDVANARIQFASGAVANLTASRLALKTERKIRIFSETAYVSADYQKKTGIAITKDANLDILEMARQGTFEDLSQMQGVDFGKMVKVEPLTFDSTDPLRAELEAFLRSVREGAPPAVTAEDGLAAVRLAAEIAETIRRHAWSSPAAR